MLVCIKKLWFQAGWLTVGENQLFELKTKLRVVLLWVSITEIDGSGGVLCAKTFLRAFVTCLDFFFPHLQISIVWVNSELCRSYQSVVVAHHKETYASWLWPFQNVQNLDSESHIMGQTRKWSNKNHSNAEVADCQRMLALLKIHVRTKFSVTKPGNSTHINLQIRLSSPRWNWTC